MKYYVVSDIHGFYDELINALTDKGFFEDETPHKLVICGDIFDRGEKTLELQSFILDLLKKNEVILVRGNHEDLLVDLVDSAEEVLDERIVFSYHWRNGTVKTLLRLADCDLNNAILYPKHTANQVKNTPFFKTILPSMKDYYETKKYIFVHGWIPCIASGFASSANDSFKYLSDWRMQDEKMWEKARWINGMAAAYNGVKEPHKTIVCGHFHCSYGHYTLEHKKKNSIYETDYSPYYAKGIIAIDACTVVSHKVNCIVLEDEEVS